MGKSCQIKINLQKVLIAFRKQRNLTPEENLYLIMAKSVELLHVENFLNQDVFIPYES